MKFIIHYMVGEYEDSFMLEGDTIEEIRAQSYAWFKSRGLDVDACNPWSEEA